MESRREKLESLWRYLWWEIKSLFAPKTFSAKSYRELLEEATKELDERKPPEGE